MTNVTTTMPAYLGAVDSVIDEVVGPAAVEVDRAALFPRASLDALGAAGLLGLVSDPAVGGMGEGPRAAALVVEQLARACGSTAMVLCMHYAGTAAVEAGNAPDEVREAIAAGRHLTTLAFSESGSRGHFWAPVSSAVGQNGQVRLDARKSWATSAGHADSYVWSSQPLAGEEMSTLWLVPGQAEGLTVAGPFDGLGLRGNASSPVQAAGVMVPPAAMLGADGEGFGLMMGAVLPIFCAMTAGVGVGIMEALTTKTAAHVSSVRLEHLGQSLADLPTVRAYVARMRLKTDLARALLLDMLDGIEQGREDAMLRVLEVKAAAGESATEVADLAMRVCAGAAYRKDVGVERHFRDARAGTVMAPTTDVLYDFIGRVECGLPLFDEAS